MPEKLTIVELAKEASWALLAAEHVSRLAYRLVDELHVVPVNHAVRDGRLLIATAAGNKLLASEMGGEVALQADDLYGAEPWSVLVRGELRHLGEDEADHFAEVAESTWIAGLKYDVIEVVPRTVTGRRAVSPPE